MEVKPKAKRVSSRKPSSVAPNGSPAEAISNGSAGSSSASKRLTRGSARPTKASSRRVKKEASDDDDDDDVKEVEEVDRKPAGRKQRVSVPETIVISDDGEEVEDVRPTRGRRAAASRRPIKKTAPPPETIVVSDDEEEEVKPSRSRKGSARPQTAKSKASARKPVVLSDDEEEEQEEAGVEEAEREEPVSVPPPAVKDKANLVESSDAEEADVAIKPVAEHVSKEEEEEEKSLLDPPRTPKAQPQIIPSIPEEPQGPRARLVIHKMALVNFKSYAGRQEIGPFHKACCDPVCFMPLN